MSSEYYDPSANDKYVEDGQTCYADDLNKVNNATNAGFEGVDVDITQAQADAIENSGLSKEWAANDAGDLPSNPAGEDPNTDKYSSRANAGEAKGWVMEDYPGEDAHLKANGDAFTERGAKILAEECAADAIIAADAAASAIAQNSIIAGPNIKVTPVGTAPDPIEFTVGFADDWFTTTTNILASQTSGQVIADRTTTQLIYDVELADKLGEYVPAGGKFFPAEAGFYHIKALMTLWVASWPADSRLIFYIYKNGVPLCGTYAPYSYGTFSRYFQAAASITVPLIFTDRIELFCYQDSGSSKALSTSSVDNHFAITRVG